MYPIDNCHFCGTKLPGDEIGTIMAHCPDADCYKKHLYRVKFLTILDLSYQFLRIKKRRRPKKAEYIYFTINGYDFDIDYDIDNSGIQMDIRYELQHITFPGVKLITVDNYLSQVEKIKELLVFS